MSSGTPDYSSLLSTLKSTSAWTPANETTLLEPYTYITAKPGKEIRGLMIDAFNDWLSVPPEKLAVISRIVSMLHSASLMVDDIEDDSQLRRGQPVTHKIYGIPQTINTANYVYFLAYKELFLLRPDPSERSEPQIGRLVSDHDLDGLVTEELLSLHRGQGLELLWRDSLQCPTEEEYIDMVNNKTGGLFRIAIKLMMACATKNYDIDYLPLVNLFGVYFQIRDDYMNLQSTEYSHNKGFAEDLTEGKFSFPIVHSVRADTSNRQVLNVLQKRPSTPTLKHHTIEYLRTRTRSLDYTFDVIQTIEKQVRSEVLRLGGNEKLGRILDQLEVTTRGDERTSGEAN